jgi:hypothetical protein
MRDVILVVESESVAVRVSGRFRKTEATGGYYSDAMIWRKLTCEDRMLERDCEVRPDTQRKTKCETIEINRDQDVGY